MPLRIIGFIGAIAGLYGYLVPPDFPNFQLYAAILGTCLFFLYAGTEIHSFVTNRDFSCDANDTKKINQEMGRIISTHGRTTILSRDISWASDLETFECLQTKAAQNELTLHLQTPNEKSEALRAAGANVIYYKEIPFVPESRFTMTNTNQPHATIAIGFVRDGKRVIRKYRNGEEASFHLANDLLRLLEVAVSVPKNA